MPPVNNFHTFGIVNHVADYILQLTYILPFFSSLNCGILVALSYDYSFTRTEQELKRVTIGYLFFSGFSWLVTFLYGYFPAVFLFLNVPSLLIVLYAQIFIYRIFHILTRISDKEKFPPAHYIAPVILAGVLLIWGWNVPQNAKLELIISRQLSLPGEYEAYSRYFTSKPLQRLLFSFIYITLSFRRIRRYYRRVNASTTMIRKPAGWVLFLCIMVVSTMLSSFITTMFPRQALFNSYLLMVATFAILGQHIILCYVLLRRSYFMYITFPGRQHEPVNKDKDDSINPVQKPGRKKYERGSMKLLKKQTFDMFMRKEKPFLDPAYKITQLVETMEVNRTYLSKFINNTYGMNFNRLMNQYRIKELNDLRGLATNRDKPLGELLGKAGFSNYKHYRRALNPGEKQK